MDRPIPDGVNLPFFCPEIPEETQSTTGRPFGRGHFGYFGASHDLFFREVSEIFIGYQGIDLVGGFKKLLFGLDPGPFHPLGIGPIIPQVVRPRHCQLDKFPGDGYIYEPQ